LLPTVLQINHESRCFGLRRYTLAFLKDYLSKEIPPSLQLSPCFSKGIYVDFTKDSIVLEDKGNSGIGCIVDFTTADDLMNNVLQAPPVEGLTLGAHLPRTGYLRDYGHTKFEECVQNLALCHAATKFTVPQLFDFKQLKHISLLFSPPPGVRPAGWASTPRLTPLEWAIRNASFKKDIMDSFQKTGRSLPTLDFLTQREWVEQYGEIPLVKHVGRGVNGRYVLA
jgi:hypothetical protein